MGAGGAGAIGEEWRSRAVTHLNIPDSFPVGEDSFVPQPFQNGAIIETRSFGRGYRGAWFLSEVRGGLGRLENLWLWMNGTSFQSKCSPFSISGLLKD